MENLEAMSGQPTQTNKQKLEEARKVISEVFQASDVEYIRVQLWHFLKAVTSENAFSFLGDPSTVLYLEKQLTKIITACRCMLEIEEAAGGDIPIDDFHIFSKEQIEADRQYMRDLRELKGRYGGTVRRLTLAETQRPILAIKRFFKVYEIEQWQEILADWVEYGLSKMSICEATGECIEVNQYELLETLLEAVYLIRSQERRSLHKNGDLRKLAGINPILELLIAALDPELIFEVAHPVIEGGSDQAYQDLLIVLPDDNHKPFREIQPVVELITAKHDRLCCSLHKLSELIQSLKAGHTYFSMVCTADNIIYQRTEIQLPTAPSESAAIIAQRSKQEIMSGLSKAKSFYLGAGFHREAGELAHGMFMLHQATELTFRAVAVSLYGIEKRTHSIRSLKRFNRRLAPQLNDVFPADTPEEERILKLLEDAYLNSRYNSKYEIARPDFETIFNQVARLLELAEKIFNENVTAFGPGLS